MKNKFWIGVVAIVVITLAVLAYGWIKSDFHGLLFFAKNNTCSPLQSPVDVSTVTSVLYPGQWRGGDYKPHGGFRFDGLNNDAVTVTAPLDAELVRVASNRQSVGLQYAMEFETDCGLRITFGHLLTVAPKFQAIFDQVTPAENDSSETHAVHPGIKVTAGEELATAVGFKWEDGSPNTSFDFGVYERWTQNTVSQDPDWAIQEDYGTYDNERGLCWLDLLSQDASEYLKALPGGDQVSGKTSSYCQ